MLSLKGYDLPLGRTTREKATRQQVFDIIAPYFLSADDMEIVAESGRKIGPSDWKHLLIRRKGCCTQA